jgi:hypothetical protein
MSAFNVQVEKLLNHVASVTDPLVDVSFADSFKGLPDDFENAFVSRDAGRFSACLARVSRQLDRSLPRINDRIVQHVSERRLEELLQSLATIYEMIADGDYDEAAAELLDAFRSGIQTLMELDRSIRERVDDHKTLQDAEMDLQQMMGYGEPTLNDISYNWPRVETWVGSLKLQDRYEKLLDFFHQLRDKLSGDLSIRDDHYEDEVQWKFVRFVHETRVAFNKLDSDLLAMCNRLKPHGDELQQVLNRMQSDDAQL